MQNIFAGLKVVDFTMNTVGPYLCVPLSAYGADVVKIENQNGDSQKSFSPLLAGI